MKTLARVACFLVWTACSSEPANHAAPDGNTNCEGRADTYYAGMKKTTSDGAITAEIASAEPAPPANSDNNNWTIKLSSGSGAPITGATIVGAPFMPAHIHGAPNQISTEIGAGSYSVGPLALRMAGLWEVTLEITPAGEPAKKVVFSFCIANE
jgi:YtkA-like protein